MDTSEQVAIETSSHTKRRRRTVEEKRRIVEETLEADASIVGNHDRWQATKMLKGPNMRCDPVVEFLGPRRFRVGVAAVGPMVWAPPPSSGALPALGLSSALPISPH
jgi:hypothetical protein